MGRKWAHVYLVVLVLLVITVFSSSSLPLSIDEMRGILQEIRKVIPSRPSPDLIFFNNIRILLMMLVPGIGLAIGAFAVFTTGLVFGAVGQCTNLPGGLLVLGTMFTPFFWLEFLAYAAVMTQNVYLVRSFIRRDFLSPLPTTGIVLITSGLFILAGAFVEASIIASMSGTAGSRCPYL